MRSPRERALFALSILFALAPFAFGLFRAVQAGDMRMFWMAVASAVGAAGIKATGKAKTSGVLAISLVALVVTTLFAGVAGYLMGATSGPGVWMVAFVFGLSWAAHYLLHAVARKS